MAGGLIRPPTIKAHHNATPPGLSDEKAIRMMLALREGRTLRVFGVNLPSIPCHHSFAGETNPASFRQAHWRNRARRT
jgi:hypothetical protein